MTALYPHLTAQDNAVFALPLPWEHKPRNHTHSAEANPSCGPPHNALTATQRAPCAARLRQPQGPPSHQALGVPVPSGLSRRHRGPAHARGILTANELSKFREKRNPVRSRWALCAGVASQPAHGPHAHRAPLSQQHWDRGQRPHVPGRRESPPRGAQHTYIPAAVRRAAARSVRSHEKSGSVRPKWP